MNNTANKWFEIVSYLFFGVATTLVNWVIYSVCIKLLGLDMTCSNAIAWGFSVIFAFVTNKLYVFKSKTAELFSVIKEFISFVIARMFSGVIEIFGPTLLYRAGLKASLFHVEGFASKIAVSVVVVILNYVLSKALVFGKKKQMNRKFVFYFLAFLIPGILMTAIYYILKITPFGDNSIAIWDAYIQYLDFFRYFRHVLQGSDSIIYSFRHFLGSTGIGTYAYYLASPFSFLIYFFEEGNEPLFLSVVSILKISMCGLTFAIYEKNRFPELKAAYGLMLSSGYAMMAYTIVQSSNTMWIDGVYMLPLILLGTWQIIHRKRSLTYILSLCGSMVFSWYTGYFNCIAVIVYFFFELLVMQDSQVNRKDFFGRTAKIALHSILGIGLGAALLFPTFLVLREGKGQLSYVFDNTLNANPVNIFQGFAMGAGKSSASLLYLFCGSVSYLGFILYFLDKKMGLKKRLCSAGTFLFMVMLAYYKPLEYIVSGFRREESYQFRFAYIIIFYVLFFAASQYEHVREISQKDFLKAGVLGSLLMLGTNYIREEVSLTNIIETVVVIVLLAILISTLRKSEKRQSVRLVMIFVLAFIELFQNGFLIEKGIGFTSASEYKEYAQIHQTLSEQLKNYDQGFYRVAQTRYRGQSLDSMITATYNDPLAYGYNGISHYSSTYDDQQAKLLINLGYSSLSAVGVNNTRILSSDSLLGVKYILTEAPISGLQLTEEENTAGNLSIYANPYALKEAVIYPESDIQAEYEEDPFAYQNQLFSQLVGEETEIFRRLDVTEEQVDEGTAYTVPACGENEIVYYFGHFERQIESKIYADDQFVSNYSCWLSPASVLIPTSNGETRVLVTNTSDAVRTYGFYALNLDKLAEISEKLNQSSVETSEIQNGSARFVVEGKENTRLLIQIPENKGWKILLNGEEARDVKKFADCLYSIGLEDGTCEITMKYTLPGFYPGVVVSILSCMLVISWFAIMKYKKKAKVDRSLNPC